MRAGLALLSICTLASLSACGSGHNDPGAVSPEEDRMLNEAASSLDANADALPENGMTNAPINKGNTQ